MDSVVEDGRGRWSAAFALTVVVLLVSVVDALALVMLPLALLMVALPAERRARWFLVGVGMWILALLFGGGPLAVVSRGWSLMIGATFLSITLIRPEWDVITRALTTVLISIVVGGIALVASGDVSELDATIREHFVTMSSATLGDLQTRMPEATWLADMSVATERIASLQGELFPALLALQSIAALALVAWWVRRLGRSDNEAFLLGRLRDFRFSDHLIWVLIGALAVLVMRLGPVESRIALNLLVFMGALYALRGFAVFVFLAKGIQSIPAMILGLVALVVLYPVALTAALMMGVSDTWLDVRNRIVSANPT
jgi:hypothetical protein